MYKKILKYSIFAAAIIFSFTFNSNLSAQLYSAKEYNNLYNEKTAVELEIRSLKRQMRNSESNYETKIKDLESRISKLNETIAGLEKQSASDNEACKKRTAELEKTISILQQKSGDREKDLIEENKKNIAAYDEQLKKLRKELSDQKERHLAELSELKKNYDSKIIELQNRINTLTDELSSLKELTKSQKKELERMSDQANELEKQLSREIKDGQIRLKKFHDRLVINIDDKISFDSGSAELKKEILPAFDKIAKIISDYPENRIMIEGHTDNIPIKTYLFPDNWQLSTQRALSVLRYIIERHKVDKSRFAAAGYGEFNPIVQNNTPENRALNRRVDIILIPRIKN